MWGMQHTQQQRENSRHLPYFKSINFSLWFSSGFFYMPPPVSVAHIHTTMCECFTSSYWHDAKKNHILAVVRSRASTDDKKETERSKRSLIYGIIACHNNFTRLTPRTGITSKIAASAFHLSSCWCHCSRLENWIYHKSHRKFFFPPLFFVKTIFY